MAPCDHAHSDHRKVCRTAEKAFRGADGIIRTNQISTKLRRLRKVCRTAEKAFRDPHHSGVLTLTAGVAITPFLSKTNPDTSPHIDSQNSEGFRPSPIHPRTNRKSLLRDMWLRQRRRRSRRQPSLFRRHSIVPQKWFFISIHFIEPKTPKTQ